MTPTTFKYACTTHKRQTPTFYLNKCWVSEWSLLNANSAISLQEQVNFQWDDDEVHFVLSQHAELDLFSASLLKQQSADRHVAPLEHIILIPRKPVFALTPLWCELSGETATNTSLIVFSLTRPGLEPTIYCARGEHANHCTTDALRQMLIIPNDK